MKKIDIVFTDGHGEHVESDYAELNAIGGFISLYMGDEEQTVVFYPAERIEFAMIKKEAKINVKNFHPLIP